uniref:Uncharacterized protein n=1 Tax=Octopus bimaculoides TaxID=37653 RepID=A0A0L8GEV3_OCTBM
MHSGKNYSEVKKKKKKKALGYKIIYNFVNDLLKKTRLKCLTSMIRSLHFTVPAINQQM